MQRQIHIQVSLDKPTQIEAIYTEIHATKFGGLIHSNLIPNNINAYSRRSQREIESYTQILAKEQTQFLQC